MFSVIANLLIALLANVFLYDVYVVQSPHKLIPVRSPLKVFSDELAVFDIKVYDVEKRSFNKTWNSTNNESCIVKNPQISQLIVKLDAKKFYETSAEDYYSDDAGFNSDVFGNSISSEIETVKGLVQYDPTNQWKERIKMIVDLLYQLDAVVTLCFESVIERFIDINIVDWFKKIQFTVQLGLHFADESGFSLKDAILIASTIVLLLSLKKDTKNKMAEISNAHAVCANELQKSMEEKNEHLNKVMRSLKKLETRNIRSNQVMFEQLRAVEKKMSALKDERKATPLFIPPPLPLPPQMLSQMMHGRPQMKQNGSSAMNKTKQKTEQEIIKDLFTNPLRQPPVQVM